MDHFVAASSHAINAQYMSQTCFIAVAVAATIAATVAVAVTVVVAVVVVVLVVVVVVVVVMVVACPINYGSNTLASDIDTPTAVGIAEVIIELRSTCVFQQ